MKHEEIKKIIEEDVKECMEQTGLNRAAAEVMVHQSFDYSVLCNYENLEDYYDSEEV